MARWSWCLQKLQRFADLVEFLRGEGPLYFLLVLVWRVIAPIGGSAVMTYLASLSWELAPFHIAIIFMALTFLLILVTSLIHLNKLTPFLAARMSWREAKTIKSKLPNQFTYSILNMSNSGHRLYKTLGHICRSKGLLASETDLSETKKSGYAPYFHGIRIDAAANHAGRNCSEVESLLHSLDFRVSSGPSNLPVTAISGDSIVFTIGYPPYRRDDPEPAREPDGFPASIHVPGSITPVDCVDMKSPRRRFYIVWDVRITARKRLNIDAHLRTYDGSAILTRNPERTTLEYLERNLGSLGKTLQSPLLLPLRLDKDDSAFGYLVFEGSPFTGIAQTFMGRRTRSIVFEDHLSGLSREIEILPELGRAAKVLRDGKTVIRSTENSEQRTPLEFERRVHLQKWEDRGDCRCFYFFVCNRDEQRTINGIRVKLEETIPSVSNWLPAPLFQKHDNEAGPRQKEFSLHPGEKKAIDLVALRQGGEIEIRHIVEGVNKHIPLNRYLFQVSISGNDVPQITREFVVSHDNVQRLLCADYQRLLSELPGRVHTLHAEITKLKDTDPSSIRSQEQFDELWAKGWRWSRDLDDLICCAYSPNESRLIISPSGGRATGHPAEDAISLYRHWHSKLQELMKEQGL